jgi:hypothetical protein
MTIFSPPWTVMLRTLRIRERLRTILQNRVLDLQPPLAGPRSGKGFFRNLVWFLFKIADVVDDMPSDFMSFSTSPN